MKTKQISKRLNLRKETIVDLNKNELMAVQGGRTLTSYPDGCLTLCETCMSTCCPQEETTTNV